MEEQGPKPFSCALKNKQDSQPSRYIQERKIMYRIEPRKSPSMNTPQEMNPTKLSICKMVNQRDAGLAGGAEKVTGLSSGVS